jgi:hypothetical protein
MRSKENKQHKLQVDLGSRINRLHILLTVMVVMAGALFVGQEALAKVFTGTAGDDTLVGTDGEDSLKGRAGEDRLKGRRGADRLKGNRGEDRLKGNSGNDKIIPGKGSDKVYAGAGNDRIYARHRRGGSHRLRVWFRQGRDHTPWGPRETAREPSALAQVRQRERRGPLPAPRVPRIPQMRQQQLPPQLAPVQRTLLLLEQRPTQAIAPRQTTA